MQLLPVEHQRCTCVGLEQVPRGSIAGRHALMRRNWRNGDTARKFVRRVARMATLRVGSLGGAR